MEASEYLARYIDRLSSASCIDRCYSSNSGSVGIPTASTPELTNILPQELQILTNPPTDVFSVDSDEEPDSDILSLLSVSDSVERPRYVPDGFHDFIDQRIIPDFSGQRKSCYYQFAVVYFSELNRLNIKQTSFHPSDLLEKPILDKAVPVMPNNPASYGNYIVARTSNRYHSEEKLFGNCSELTDTPFNHLWRAYLEHHHSYPKCIIIYSWNFPCSRCTDLILKSVGEPPYSSVNTVLAHTAFWSKDTHHEMNRKRLESKNIAVERVPYCQPSK